MSQVIEFPLSPQCNAFVLNGTRSCLSLHETSSVSEQWKNYASIIVTDGAWNDFATSEVGYCVTAQSAEKVIVLGDGDSIAAPPQHFINTPDQDFTDFEKAIRYGIDNGITQADVFWASGGEMDHFLGNLSVACKYHDAIRLRFVDNYQYYMYLGQGEHQIKNAKGKTLSIYPFPEAHITSRGLQYPLDNLRLSQHQQQSLRNRVVDDGVHLSVIDGGAWVFIKKTIH